MSWRICNLAIIMAGLLAACASPSPRRADFSFGESIQAKREKPEGHRVFMQHCHYCHPGGEAGLGPALNDKQLPARLIKFQVRHGLGAMPALTKDRVSDGELDAVVDYLIALRSTPPFVP